MISGIKDLHQRKRGMIMNNIILWIVAIVGGVTGLLTTLYLTISFPAVIIWKIYRRIVHGIPVTK